MAVEMKRSSSVNIPITGDISLSSADSAALNSLYAEFLPKSTDSDEHQVLQRRLSFVGKALLKQAFSLPKNSTSAQISTENGVKPEFHHPLRRLTSAIEAPPLSKLYASSKSQSKDNINPKSNAFAAFNDSDSDSSTDSDSDSSDSDSDNSSVSSNSTWFKNRKQHFDFDNSGWDTVRVARKAFRQPQEKKSFTRDKYPWEMEGYNDETVDGNLAEVQWETQDFNSSRQWGADRKSRQFKAQRQRNYAIQKRNVQRGG